jgi:hypothetical protein
MCGPPSVRQDVRLPAAGSPDRAPPRAARRYRAVAGLALRALRLDQHLGVVQQLQGLPEASWVCDEEAAAEVRPGRRGGRACAGWPCGAGPALARGAVGAAARARKSRAGGRAPGAGQRCGAQRGRPAARAAA